MKGHYKTPFGWVEYETEEALLLNVSWMDIPPEVQIKHPKLHDFWKQWFLDPTIRCPYSFEVKGTEFQLGVWSQLQKIPLGNTQTYKEIAMAIGSPKAQQAVGQACKANPITLLVPCHRVLGQNDRLTGYVGTKLLSTKKRLLRWERGLTICNNPHNLMDPNDSL